MSNRSDEFTKIDTIYTLRKKLLLQVKHPVFVSEIVQIASSLNLPLDGLDLSGVRAPKLFFLYQSLNDSSFEDSYLPSSRFGKCLMERSNLNNVILSGSDMRKTIFSGSTFINSNLRSCDLRNSFFINCDFTGADLSNCDLRYSIFVDSDFSRSDLRGATLEGVDLSTCKKDLIKITHREKIEIFKLN